MKKITVIIAALAVLVVGIALTGMTYYTTQLSLALNGESQISIGLNGVYEEKGAKATINGSDLSDKVKVQGEVDTTKPGTYILEYKIATLTMERKVTVTDKMDPELYLEGQDEIEMLLGESFEEPGFRAVDSNGNDITDQVEVDSSKLTRAGENYITYTVYDGQKGTQLKRKVNVKPNTEYDAPGLAICMFHYVYDENDPPEDLQGRYTNYIKETELEEEFKWLKEEGYYFPTWKEVREYVDGELLLPEKSIVLTFDDGNKTFLEQGIPIAQKYQVPVTSFLITSYSGEKKVKEYSAEYVNWQSHSHNMHRPGGNIGHGGIFTAISYEEGIADLEESIKICGSGEAFAYPFGDYNDHSRQMIEDAGFYCAVTTQPGKAYPGDDPLLLDRVRMFNDQSLEEFISKVAPPENQEEQ